MKKQTLIVEGVDSGYPKIEGDQTYDFDIVGESYYQDALNEICGGKTEGGHECYCEADLIPEPDNPYDSNAVAVHISGIKVGHLTRNDAVEFNREPGHAVTVDAVIVGGWVRGHGDTGHYGVKLDI